MGFLHSTIEGQKEPRVKAIGLQLPLIPMGGEIYAEAFQVMGCCTGHGYGPMPLPYTEIAAGAPWATERDRHVIRRMSQAYVNGVRAGSDPLAKPPMER